MTNRFYADLPPLHDRQNIIRVDQYRELPDDWWVIVTDIKGSTTAVSQGRYKEINLIGAACITSSLNACSNLKIPYIFGGDGATILIPGEFKDKVLDSLAQLILLADSSFGFDLRVGAVHYSQIKAAGHPILVARLETSKTMDQCLLQGTGVSEAERLTKLPGSSFLLSKPTALENPLLEGLECRWEPVGSRAGRFMSLLVAPLSSDPTKKQQIISEVLEIASASQGNSIKPEQLKLSFNPMALSSEAKLRSSAKFTEIWTYVAKSLLLNIVGWISAKFSVTIGGYSGTKYQKEVTENTDAFKYDEVLRMVIDLDKDQEARLVSALEDLRKQGAIAYGIHYSSTALLTCMVFDRNSNHVHLIDGNDGGYTAASKELKRQLKETKSA